MEGKMITYNHWYDKNLTFYNEINIDLCQCNVRGQLNIFELLRLATSIADEDYTRQGLSRKILHNHGVTILLSRIMFHFCSLPRANDRITISTWEEKPGPFQLTRAYNITAQNKKILIKGYSSWLLVDYKSHKIIRTKKFTLRPESTRQESGYYRKLGKISIPHDLVFLGKRYVYFSDIDINGHMNASRYCAFAIDCLPEIYQEKDFTDFFINYSKETIKDETIYLFGAVNLKEQKITVIGKQGEHNCFESNFYYT